MSLKLSDVKKKLPFNISKGMSMESIRRFSENNYGDKFDFDVFLPSIGKNLQRPLVWDAAQKQELVLSVLKGVDIRTISLIQFREKTGSVDLSRTLKFIDGKQRFTTLISFYRGEFPLTVNGEQFFFKDLDEECQNIVAGFEFNIDVAYEYAYDMISDEDKIAWFSQINFAGTPQDRDHIENLKTPR